MPIIATEKVARPFTGQKQAQSLRQQGATGIILFTSTGQLLFMNSEAQAFTRRLQPLSTRESGTGLIPEEIHAVVRDLISRLMHCDHPKDCESIQAERLCFETIIGFSSVVSVFPMNPSRETADSSSS